MRASMWRRRRRRRMRKVWARKGVWVYLRKKARSEDPLTVTRSTSRAEKVKP